MAATASPGSGCAAGSAPRSPSRRPAGPRPAGAATSPLDAPNEKLVGDITYLPCADGTQPVPGHGDRLLLPPAGRLVDRRPHAHRARRRRAARRGRDPRGLTWPGRSSTRPRSAVHVPGLRRPLRPARGDAARWARSGSSADNALAESFNATLKRETLAGAAGWEHPGRGPPGGVRLDHPLQHPPPALRLRPDQPERLRGPPGPSYAANRGVDTPRVSKIKGQGPCARRRAPHPRTASSNGSEPTVSPPAPNHSQPDVRRSRPSSSTAPGTAAGDQFLLVVLDARVTHAGTAGKSPTSSNRNRVPKPAATRGRGRRPTTASRSARLQGASRSAGPRRAST